MADGDVWISGNTIGVTRMNTKTNVVGTVPSSPIAGQVWLDTANNLLKIRNAANNAWLTVGPSTNYISSVDAGYFTVTAGQITFSGTHAQAVGATDSPTFDHLYLSAATGIVINTDVNLYRYSADILKTDDALQVVGELRTNTQFYAINSGTGVVIPPYQTNYKIGTTGHTLIHFVSGGGNDSNSTHTGYIFDYILENDGAGYISPVNFLGWQWGIYVVGTGYVDRMTLIPTGQLQLPITGTTGGLLIGGDTLLYRSAANNLMTDDDFEIATGKGLVLKDVDGNRHRITLANDHSLIVTAL